MRRWVPNFLSFAPNEGQTRTASRTICGKVKMFKQRGASVVLEGRPLAGARRGKRQRGAASARVVAPRLGHGASETRAGPLWGVKRGGAGLQKST